MSTKTFVYGNAGTITLKDFEKITKHNLKKMKELGLDVSKIEEGLEEPNA